MFVKLGYGCRFGVHSEFLVDMFDVRADGAVAQTEVSGDFLVKLALRQLL